MIVRFKMRQYLRRETVNDDAEQWENDCCFCFEPVVRACIYFILGGYLKFRFPSADLIMLLECIADRLRLTWSVRFDLLTGDEHLDDVPVISDVDEFLNQLQ